MTRFSSSTTKDGSGVVRNLKKGGIVSTFFLAYYFRQKVLGESGGMLPREIFENLHAVMVILVHFE